MDSLYYMRKACAIDISIVAGQYDLYIGTISIPLQLIEVDADLLHEKILQDYSSYIVDGKVKVAFCTRGFYGHGIGNKRMMYFSLNGEHSVIQSMPVVDVRMFKNMCLQIRASGEVQDDSGTQHQRLIDILGANCYNIEYMFVPFEEKYSTVMLDGVDTTAPICKEDDNLSVKEMTEVAIGLGNNPRDDISGKVNADGLVTNPKSSDTISVSEHALETYCIIDHLVNADLGEFKPLKKIAPTSVPLIVPTVDSVIVPSTGSVTLTDQQREDLIVNLHLSRKNPLLDKDAYFLFDYSNAVAIVNGKESMSYNYAITHFRHGALQFWEVALIWHRKIKNHGNRPMKFPIELVKRFRTFSPDKKRLICQLDLHFNRHDIEIIRTWWCVYCRLQMCHDTLYCPLYITVPDRIKQARDLHLCPACFKSDKSCGLGRGGHKLRPCSECSSEMHSSGACNDAETCHRVAQAVYRVHAIVSAIGDWDVEDIYKLSEELALEQRKTGRRAPIKELAQQV